MCDLCESENSLEGLPFNICRDCLITCTEIHESMEKAIKEAIDNLYGIIKIDKFPLELCVCDGKGVIVVDYYMVDSTDNDDEYEVILCCICRHCNGYVEHATKTSFPLNVKPFSDYTGIVVKNKNDEYIDYIG